MNRVIIYGNLQKAQTILGCVQASITGASEVLSRKHGRSDTHRLIEQHVMELEVIEQDLVAIINAALEYGSVDSDSGVLGNAGGTVPGEQPN